MSAVFADDPWECCVRVAPALCHPCHACPHCPSPTFTHPPNALQTPSSQPPTTVHHPPATQPSSNHPPTTLQPPSNHHPTTIQPPPSNLTSHHRPTAACQAPSVAPCPRVPRPGPGSGGHRTPRWGGEDGCSGPRLRAGTGGQRWGRPARARQRDPRRLLLC